VRHGRSLAASGLVLLIAAAPPAPPPHRAAPVAGSLVSLISADDYPNAALLNEEQGDVTVALAIDPKGGVTSCSLKASSGSDSLDTTTCRVLIERARFTPAHDRRGRPVADTYTQKIAWRIQADSGISASVDPYLKCLVAAADRLAAGPGSEEEVADAAYAACTAEERAQLQPPGAPLPAETVQRVRATVRAALLATIRTRRAHP